MCPGLADPESLLFPWPLQEGHGDLCIGGAGTPDTGGGTCHWPNGAEATFRSADVEHFPAEHRLVLTGGSE